MNNTDHTIPLNEWAHLAAYYHGGQASTLYAVASTGALSPGTLARGNRTACLYDLADQLAHEIRGAIRCAEETAEQVDRYGPGHEWHRGESPDDYHSDADDLREMLTDLSRWIDEHEPAIAAMRDETLCPACAEPSDYCPGHGPTADPAGAAIIEHHDDGWHIWCHPTACEHRDPDRTPTSSPHEASR